MPRWGFAMLQIRERALLATDIGCGENSSSRTRSPLAMLEFLPDRPGQLYRAAERAVELLISGEGPSPHRHHVGRRKVMVLQPLAGQRGHAVRRR
jgi:hypothetical protein